MTWADTWIWTFNPGDTTAVPVLDFGWARPVDVLVQGEAFYVLDFSGKVYEYALPPSLDLE